MSGETQESVSGWTVDTLRKHFEEQIKLLRETMAEQRNTDRAALDERQDAQDAALIRAFDAQQKAMSAAFDSAEKAVAAALTAQKEAVGKAEVASEKRFESVNEFRGQLADQARTLMPRSESEARHGRNAEQLQDAVRRIEAIAAVRDGRIGELEQFRALVTAQQANVDGRMHQLNQLRQEVIEDRARFVPREAFDAQIATLAQKLDDLRIQATTLMRIDTFDAVQSRLDAGAEQRTARISALENWRSKATGVMAVLVFAMPPITAILLKVFTR